MRWLVVEDSLVDRKGHWFEYLAAFHEELPSLGDGVAWLVPQNAGVDVRVFFGGLPVLPESAFRKMSDGAPAWRRYARIPSHAWKTFWTVRRYLKSGPMPDVIFVPTVILHHLLGWYWLIKTTLRQQPGSVLLFFPGLPLYRPVSGVRLNGSLTARFTRFLIRRLASEIHAGKVILGVETEAMRLAATEIFGVPFTYFPHPVAVGAKAEMGKAETLKSEPLDSTARPADIQNSDASFSVSKFQGSAFAGASPSRTLTMACYGPARYEKGSNILVVAIEQYLHRFPDSSTRFVIQWLDDFSLPDGTLAVLPSPLKNHPRVEVINRFFGEGEYTRRLAQTDVLLLPYRRSSYGLRVSRVVIEAMVHGLPVIATCGTTLAGQAERFGAAIPCKDGDVGSLVEMMHRMEQTYPGLKDRAEQQKPAACNHFSVQEFRRTILET